MEWSNEKALEFLELFQTEPCLWDPRLKGFKNRGVQNDAWRRIKQALQFPTTVEDLKKKKESLMGYYRVHLNKYKKSLKSGAGTNGIYSTNWFAFELMDSFLRPVYKNNSTLNMVGTSSDATVSEDSEGQENDSHTDYPTLSTYHDQNSSAIKRPSSSQSNSQSTGKQHFVRKKVPPELIAAKKQMDEAFDCMKSITSQKQRNDFDEYDHFGLMVAAKIRKINNFFDREFLMNTIQNLVFQTITKNETSPCSTSIEVEEKYNGC